MNSVRSSNLSLKYQRFTTSGCKDIGIRISICDKDLFPLFCKVYADVVEDLCFVGNPASFNTFWYSA